MDRADRPTNGPQSSSLLQPAIQAGWFDLDWYRTECGIAFADEETAWQDYVWRGRFAAIDPSERFDSMGYLNGNRSVYRQGLNPLVHFLSLDSLGERRFFEKRIAPVPRWQLEHVDRPVSESPGAGVPARVAIHAHVFHPELVPSICERIANLPRTVDVFVSVPNASVGQSVSAALSGADRVAELDVRVVPNRGRNFGPLLTAFDQDLLGYDVVAHVHSKRSNFVDAPHWQWSEYLLEYTIGVPDLVSRVVALFEQDPNLGIVHPVTHPMLGATADHWGRNSDAGARLAQLLGEPGLVTNGPVVYPVGAMFWFRPAAILPLLANVTPADIPDEPVSDGSLLHAIERVIGTLALHRGYKRRLVLPRGLRLADCASPPKWPA